MDVCGGVGCCEDRRKPVRQNFHRKNGGAFAGITVPPSWSKLTLCIVTCLSHHTRSCPSICGGDRNDFCSLSLLFPYQMQRADTRGTALSMGVLLETDTTSLENQVHSPSHPPLLSHPFTRILRHTRTSAYTPSLCFLLSQFLHIDIYVGKTNFKKVGEGHCPMDMVRSLHIE